jgi:FMN phosphatase YigB (HAD superfamily)
MNRTPVFDIGDTLVPSTEMIRDTVRQILQEEGYSDIPVYPEEKENIYLPEQVGEWLEEEGFEADPEKITERYIRREKSYLKDKILEVLRKCENLGTIGFISDNPERTKEIYREVLREYGIKFKGFVVSGEVGVEKPSKKIFEEFISRRDREGERFTYFGNRADIDSAAKKVGMEFVQVTQHNTFGTSWKGKQIEKLDYEKIKQAVEN